MKNILFITFFSFFIAGCSTNKINLQSHKEIPITNTKYSEPSKKEESLSLTYGKEIPSNRKYCYVWQLENQDKSILLSQQGMSDNTKYVSWPTQTKVVKKDNYQHDLFTPVVHPYKFTNEEKFSIKSKKIEVKSFFYLEQNEDDIYISFINYFVFKDVLFPKNNEIDLVNTVQLKIGETIIIQVPTPYTDDHNKFYSLKFTINAFD